MKRFLCALLALTMLFSILPMSALAAEQPPLVIDIQTNKVSYGTFCAANVQVTVTNVSTDTINGIDAEAALDNLTRTKGITAAAGQTLAAGASFQLNYKVMLGKEKGPNLFQRFWLFILRLFRRLFAGKDSGFDPARDKAFVQETKDISFGKFTAKTTVTAWYTQTKEHTHTWGDWQNRVPAACLTKGTDFRTCASCDKEETRETKALGHQYVSTVTPPTCTAQGYTTHTCSRDKSHVVVDTPTDALGHDWGKWVVTTPASETAPGTETSVCNRSKSHTQTREIPVLAHTHAYVSVVTPPTCTTQGYTTHTCSKNKSHVLVDTYVAATGHSWKSWTAVTPATCAEEGSEKRVCANNSAHSETQAIPALGHAYGSWTVITPAECVTAGSEKRICGNDNNHAETRAIPALGHNFVAVVTAPSCTAQGYTTRTCSHDAGHVLVDTYTAATGHSWGAWAVTTPASESAAGEETRICERDGSHVQTRAIPALEHTHAYVAVVTPPTCTAQGYTTHTCSKDTSHVFVDTYTAATGHAWGSWAKTAAAKCTEEGAEKRVCANDGAHTETRAIPVLGHAYGSWTETAPAACETAGSEQRVCGNDNNHAETQAIPALGHDYIDAVTAPTCTAQGYTTHTCSRDAGHVVTDSYVPAIGHDWGSWTTVTSATCTVNGTEKRVCANDGAHTETRAIPALGHAYGSWMVTAPAACETAGSEKRVCGNDNNHAETQAIPALGHDYIDAVTAPTCTAQGYTTHTCSRDAGHVVTNTYVPAIGHDWGSWTTVASATCTVAGSEQRVCGNDSGHTQTQTIPALGHAYGAWTVTTQAVCETAGSEQRVCGNDSGHIETQTVPALGHDYVPVITAPDCTAQGYTTRTCSRDAGHVVTDSYVPAIGHAWGGWTVVTPTECETAGAEKRVCGNDGTHTETRAIDALGHAWGGWTTVASATCTVAGSEQRVCGNDAGHTETRAIAALGHDYVAVVTAPTCTAQGYTTHTCSRNAGHVVMDSYVPAIGHAWGGWTTVASATCTVAGSEQRICGNDAGHTETRAIAALGHDYVPVVTAPTSTSQGFTTYTCSNDTSHSYIGDYVPALGWTKPPHPNPTNGGTLNITQPNLLTGATRVNASPATNADNLVTGSGTAWQGRANGNYATFSFAGGAQTFNTVVVNDTSTAVTTAVTKFSIHAMIDGSWVIVYKSDQMGQNRVCSFDTVTATQICLQIDAAASSASISYMRVYNIAPEESRRWVNVVEWHRFDWGNDLRGLDLNSNEAKNQAKAFDVYNEVIIHNIIKWEGSNENSVMCVQGADESWSAATSVANEVTFFAPNLEKLRGLINMRTATHDVKVLACFVTGDITTRAATSAARKVIIDQIMAFTNKYNLDGIDIDWEGIAWAGKNYTNYNNFILELKAAMPAGKILSVSFCKNDIDGSVGSQSYHRISKDALLAMDAMYDADPSNPLSITQGLKKSLDRYVLNW